METNPPPSFPSSSSSSSEIQVLNPSIFKSPDNNGLLRLEGNPSPWIHYNPINSHLKVQKLVLDFSTINDVDHEIADSINKFTFLTHLTICHYNSLKSLPFSISTLHNLTHLKFQGCGFQQFPSNLSLLKSNLTHLTFSGCNNIKSIPEIVTTVSNLTCFDLKDCNFLSELTPSLGQLRTLTQLTIYNCKFKSFPKSIANLSNLTTLHLNSCGSLTELPSNFGLLRSLTELSLEKSYIKFLPESIVTRSTLKRGENDHEIELPSSKKPKQCHDSKGGEPKMSNDAKESHMEVPEHVEVHLDGVNQSNIEQPNESSSPFDFVKACYEGDSLWIDFSLTSRFDKLNNSVCKKFELEVNKFKIKYLDEDNEWMLMTCVSDLTHAQLHTSSSGRNFVRLSITDTRVVNTDMHLDGATQSNTPQSNGSSSSFDFVKACYDGDPVWIEFSLTSSFDQLNESICKKFGLEMNELKIKYLDEDKEWLLMTCVIDLTHSLLHTSSSGRKFVRLSIIDSGVVNSGRASEENNERIILEKSKRGSTWVFNQCEREKKYVQSVGENSNQPSSEDCISCPDFSISRIKSLIEGHVDVKADGNCGFRVIATFEYGDEEKWLDVRVDLLKELITNKDLYKKALGGEEEFERAYFIANSLTSPAKKIHWFEATCLGLVVATKYQKVFTCWSSECCTYLPLESWLVDHKPPNKYINMARKNENHFIALQMPSKYTITPS